MSCLSYIQMKNDLLFSRTRFDGPRGGGRPPPQGGFQQAAPQHNVAPANGYGPPS